MGATLAILRKELRSYFSSPIAYVFIMLFLAYTSLRFFAAGSTETSFNFFMKGQASLTDFFSFFPESFMIMVPALAMRLWPDEMKSGTMEVLNSLPIRAWQIVAGKYLAAVTVIALAILLTFPVPILVGMVAHQGGTTLDSGPILGGYVGSLLTGAAFMAVGTFMAALAKEQVTAFLLALLVCVFLGSIGDTFFLLFTPKPLVDVSKFIGFGPRFDSIERGVLDVRDLFYYFSFCVAFCFANVAVIQCRKWK